MKRALLSLGLPALPALLACGGGTDGTQPVTPVPPAGRLAIVVNFCLQDNIYAGERGVPTFFAYRNDGEVWTPLFSRRQRLLRVYGCAESGDYIRPGKPDPDLLHISAGSTGRR